MKTVMYWGSLSKSFRSRPSLVDAARDPAILRLVDDFELDTGRYIALVVANDEYEFWDSLETPRRDAELVGSILESQYGFEVTYLENASRRDTLRALYDIGERYPIQRSFPTLLRWGTA